MRREQDVRPLRESTERMSAVQRADGLAVFFVDDLGPIHSRDFGDTRSNFPEHGSTESLRHHAETLGIILLLGSYQHRLPLLSGERERTSVELVRFSSNVAEIPLLGMTCAFGIQISKAGCVLDVPAIHPSCYAGSTRCYSAVSAADAYSVFASGTA